MHVDVVYAGLGMAVFYNKKLKIYEDTNQIIQLIVSRL